MFPQACRNCYIDPVEGMEVVAVTIRWGFMEHTECTNCASLFASMIMIGVDIKRE